MSAMNLVRARRRIVMRVGFVALVVLTATACIFDKGGDYQGGGRNDKGATAKTADPDPTVDPIPTDTTTTPPPLDAGTTG